MLKRTVLITSSSHLYLRNFQLIIENKENGTRSSVPIEDLSMVIIENQQVNISIPVMNQLASENVSVVFCDASHVPTTYLAPFECNTLQGERYRIQINAKVQAIKSAWKQLIEAKIRNQSMLLIKFSKDGDILKPYYSNVKNDDIDNREGIAARIYWKELFDSDFMRSRYGEEPNSMLNYGYSILRAVTLRGIIGCGMLPSLGLHHKNRYNPFPLADDIMEPYRPYIDEVVYELFKNGYKMLDKSVKSKLINVVYADVKIDNNIHPLNIAVSMTCTSILKLLNGDTKKILLPQFR